MDTESKDKIRCWLCGITEEEALKEGSAVKKAKSVEVINTKDCVINMAFSNDNSTCLCTE